MISLSLILHPIYSVWGFTWYLHSGKIQPWRILKHFCHVVLTGSLVLNTLWGKKRFLISCFLLSYQPLERKKYCFGSNRILQQEMHMCDYRAKDFLSNVLFIFWNTYFLNTSFKGVWVKSQLHFLSADPSVC